MPKVPRAGFAGMMKDGAKVGRFRPASNAELTRQPSWPMITMLYVCVVLPYMCSTFAAWMKPFLGTWRLAKRYPASRGPRTVLMVRTLVSVCRLVCACTCCWLPSLFLSSGEASNLYKP